MWLERRVRGCPEGVGTSWGHPGIVLSKMKKISFGKFFATKKVPLRIFATKKVPPRDPPCSALIGSEEAAVRYGTANEV